MRIFLLFILLLLNASVTSAQPDTVKESGLQNYGRVRSASQLHDLRMENYDLQIKLKNKDLDAFILSYSDASPLKKNMLADQVEAILFEIFDLNLKKKEEEAEMLNEKLKELESHDVYQDKAAEIRKFQQALDEVQTILNFRRENRENIVEQRLKDVLKE
ncbi:MAG: hypothetical protein KDE26_00685 [Bacteroidetes bacterium]|nr:hypothetical protein [Bacteroidota bacterium]MCB0841765.1 hypothetical protein [Bacteroidota bacterium]